MVQFKNFLLASIIATTVFPTLAASEDADTVFTNGRIYTVNEAQPWAEAVAIKDGKFLAVGSAAEIAEFTGDTTEVVDLAGGFAMPGINDAHAHPYLVYVYEEWGEYLVPETTSPDDLIAGLKIWAEENPDVDIIRARRWNSANFPGGKATKDWLDPHFPDRAVYLEDNTGHNAVLNSVALERAGITKDTPDPEFGAIDRDPDTGEPTGYVSEAGMYLIGQFVQRPDVETSKRAITRSLDEMRAFGITSTVDALVGPDGVEAYLQLEREGTLDMRVDLGIAINDYQAEATTLEESLALLERQAEFDTPLIDLRAKFFADGTPISKTALMVEPYSNDPSTFGIMTIGVRQFELMKQFHRQGIQIMAHSTTDGTTRKLLDVFEEARAEDPRPELRHQIAHLLSVKEEDIARFRELNVVAEFSPIWFYPTDIGEIASAMLGAARYARWQAISEFVDAEVTVAVGSDWPAGTPDADPWKGVEGMVTRMDPFTNEGPALGAPINLETAVRIVTLGGASAMMQDEVTGSIEVGKHADMILLDRDLFKIPAVEISEVNILKTIFAGKVVYGAE